MHIDDSDISGSYISTRRPLYLLSVNGSEPKQFLFKQHISLLVVVRIYQKNVSLLTGEDHRQQLVIVWFVTLVQCPALSVDQVTFVCLDQTSILFSI